MTELYAAGTWEATGCVTNWTPKGDQRDRTDMLDWSSPVDGPAPFTENEHGDFERRETQQVARAFGRTAEEARARARFLAEAPDMLAMLRHVSHLNSFRELNDILPEVRALISKATATSEG